MVRREFARILPVTGIGLLVVVLVVPLGATSSIPPAFVSTQPAHLVIGQAAAFTTRIGATTSAALRSPAGVAFDGSGNLWVTDSANDRILEYATPFSSGEPASLVIGQASFTAHAPAASAARLSAPGGLAFDGSGNLWVADSDNNRVLEYTTPLSIGEAASLVIGQSSFTTRACATTQNGLCHPTGVAFDASGNLWVADYGRHRVLEYTSPFSIGEAASLVLGQTLFTTSSPATTATGLHSPAALAFDGSGNLWVADSGNNRVVEYPTPFSTGEAALLVLGQTVFTTSFAAATASGLRLPTGLAFGGSGNLWVADSGNSRAIEYTSPLSTGQAASLVLGQSGFATGACTVTQTGLCVPKGIALDGSGALWIADSRNNRALGYTSPLFTDQPASLEIGQAVFSSHAPATTQTGLRGPVAVAFDSAGNLWVADRVNNRILEYVPGSFACPPDQFCIGMKASLVIGQAVFTTRAAAASGMGLRDPMGLAFDGSGNLWVADSYNNRVLEFKAPFSSGEAASLVLGQTGFTRAVCGRTTSGMCHPDGLAFDGAGNLWVSDSINDRILEFTAPLVSGEAATLVIGATGSSGRPVCTRTATGLCRPGGLAFDGTGNLWVADSDYSRALEYTAPFSTGEAASLVIGQTDFTSIICTRTQTGLCRPDGLAFDGSGNLWVVDSQNDRALEYTTPFSTGEAASVVIGQTSFTRDGCVRNQTGLCHPSGLAFDGSGNLWVADSNGDRVLEFL